MRSAGGRAWAGRAAFAEMLHIYGSFDAYLHQGLMLTDADIAAIRARLLA